MDKNRLKLRKKTEPVPIVPDMCKQKPNIYCCIRSGRDRLGFYAETLIQCIEEKLTHSCSHSRRTDRVCAPRVSERPEEVTRTTRRRTTFVATLLSTQPLWPPSSSIAQRRSLLASIRSTLGSPRSIRVSLRRTHDSRPRKIRDSRPRIRDSPPSDRILAKQRGQQR